MFHNDELVILNEKVRIGLPNRVGEVVKIYCKHQNSTNYDYTVELDNGDLNPVKESEINKLTDEQKELVTFIKKDNQVLYTPTSETVMIMKADFLHGQVEIQFQDNGVQVVGIETLKPIEEEIWRMVEQPEELEQGKFTELGLEIGKFTDKKNKQYGSSVDATYEMIKVLMERYKNNDSTYTIPESLLQHILLQVRMMDKQNRIFNNPSGEGDSESPYNDLAGYSLIGIDMVAK